MKPHTRSATPFIALVALLRPMAAKRRWVRRLLIPLGIFGAALLYGDGTITPAISVLSAIEGLVVVNEGTSFEGKDITLSDVRAGGGDSVAGSLVTAKRDETGDEEDKPLKLKITKPRKKPAKKEPEKVGVAAPAQDAGEPSPDKPSEPPADAGGGGAAESASD